MKTLRAIGEFVSIAGVRWRVELWKEGYTGTAQEMSFPGDEPLVITWDENERLAPVEGSTATLQLISESDRQYIDLYSIERTHVRLDVYREDNLYWQGTLDSEFYEEPYEALQGYVVSLTFSDFGVLADVDYDLIGVQTIEDVVKHGLELAGLTIGIDQTKLRSGLEDGTRATLDTLRVRSDNYYDEDGEATKYREVLESLLQPLASKIRQRGGKILAYDLNGLYVDSKLKGVDELQWDGETQTLSMAEVAQKIKVNFSPYGNSELLIDELEYTAKTSPNVRNKKSTNPNDPEYGEYYTFYNDYTSQITSTIENYAGEYESFNVFVSATDGKGLAYINPEAAYAQIVPIFGNAEERACVAWRLMVGQGDMSKDLTKTEVRHLWRPAITESRGSNKVILRTKRAYVAGYTPTESNEVPRYLRLTLPLLMDARYNPFDNKSDNLGNERDHDYYVKVRTGYVFVPVKVTIYDAPEGGNAICHYDNSAVASKSSGKYAGNGEWIAGEGAVGDMWLEYYNTSDLKEDCGIRGWTQNRALIGRVEVGAGRPSGGGRARYSELTEREKQIDDGEYISYPTQGGWIEITVYEGYRAYDYDEEATFDEASKYWDKSDTPYRAYIRWLMYGAPTMELVRGNGNIEQEEVDDIEYSGWITRMAKEELSINTTYGTVDPASPAARGAIIKGDGTLLKKLTRAGVTDIPERLLIGTAISQYGERRLKFSGDATIQPGKVLACHERLQGDTLFWIAGERQNIITDVSEVTIIELAEEAYAPIEE